VEGRILEANIVRGKYGSKGYGFVEFYNSRDAWRSIQKWNNTSLGGRMITVEYGRRRRFRNNNRRFNYNYNNNQNRRFNQPRQFGFRRGGKGGFRPRGNRY
jgi:RNA recognition motif-containing protein